MAADMSLPVAAERWLGCGRGLLITVEGLWGAGKTTLAAGLGRRLTQAGFSTTVVHYGHRSAVLDRLSAVLEDQPLRRRDGRGGYRLAHHATVDVLLRLCREAYDHRYLYTSALTCHDVVIVDHGVYAKLAYAVTVLAEQHADRSVQDLLGQVDAVAAPWFLHPDRAVWLDTAWPLARERAIGRGHGGGRPGSLERLLFLPRFEAAYRTVLAAHSGRVRRIRVGTRPPASVVDEAVPLVTELLSPSREAS